MAYSRDDPQVGFVRHPADKRASPILITYSRDDPQVGCVSNPTDQRGPPILTTYSTDDAQVGFASDPTDNQGLAHTDHKYRSDDLAIGSASQLGSQCQATSA